MKKIVILFCIWVATAFAGVGTSYRYDAVGRLSQVIYPQGKTIQYTYDVRGNMLERRVTQLCYEYQLLCEQFSEWPNTRDVQNFVGLISCTITTPKTQSANK